MTVLVKGASTLRGKLNAYAAKLAAPLAMWEEIAAGLEAAERAWFEAEGEGSWQPLSLAYAARKVREFPGKPILQASGELLDWMTNPALAKRIPAPDVMQWVNGYATPEGDWNIALLHRDGTPRMPARSPVIPTDRLHELSLAAARVHARWP